MVKIELSDELSTLYDTMVCCYRVQGSIAAMETVAAIQPPKPHRARKAGAKVSRTGKWHAYGVMCV